MKTTKCEVWYEVAHNTGAVEDTSRPFGCEWPAATLVRFRSQGAAHEFAATATRDGKPAKVRPMEVRRSISSSWTDVVTVTVTP